MMTEYSARDCNAFFTFYVLLWKRKSLAIEVGDPNGGLGIVKIHVLIGQVQGITTENFREYLTTCFAPSAVKDEHVLKIRLHLFELPDVSRPDFVTLLLRPSN